MSKSNLRQDMPLVTAFIDAFREAFGSSQINRVIKAGIDGQSTFYASENGVEIGTKAPDRGIPLSEMQIGASAAATPASGKRK